MDLISRQKAIEAMESVDWYHQNRRTGAEEGKWVPNHDGSWNCSECGLRVLVYAKGNFCPNCGTDMRGEKE